MQTRVARILDMKGRTVFAVSGRATVAAAVELMNERNIGSLMVSEGSEIVGIFTERDVLVRVVAAGRDPQDTPVAEVMTTEIIAIEPDTTIEQAMHVITHERCRHLPVFDGEELCGMVSSGDLTRWMIRDQKAEIIELIRYVSSG